MDKEDTGVVTAALREEVARQAAAHPEVVFYADSRFFIRRFRNVVVKCNEKETTQAIPLGASGSSEDAVFAFIDRTRRETGRGVFVTCGGRGIACEDNGRKLIVPAVRQQGEIDICGAGDAATAGIVCALCAGASPSEAAFVGNLTAGVAVRKLGTTGTADRGEVLSLYDEQFSY